MQTRGAINGGKTADMDAQKRFMLTPPKPLYPSFPGTDSPLVLSAMALEEDIARAAKGKFCRLLQTIQANTRG